MLSRPPSCGRAVHKTLSTTIESIWVSEDVLCHEWQRFVAGCKIGRRYGSFVPGPLEARRRMGKRRMAHLSEAFPPPLHGITSLWSLWGSFWEVDRSQWQWQAPRNKKSDETEDPSSFVQDSSSCYETQQPVIKLPVLRAAAIPNPNKDIILLRKRLKECRLDELPAICASFNQTFSHIVSLGLLDNTTTILAIKGVSNDLHTTFPLAASTHHLSFYTAIWEGLVGSRVVRIEESPIPGLILKLLSQLPWELHLGSITLSVISRLSASQLASSNTAIYCIVDRQVDAWLRDCAVKVQSHSYKYFKQFEKLLHRPIRPQLMGHKSQIDKLLRGQRSKIESHRPLGSQLTGPQSLIKKQAAHQRLRAMDGLIPSELCNIMGYLPRSMIHDILRNNQQFVAETTRNLRHRQVLCMGIRWVWLLMVSRLPIGTRFFYQTWKFMDSLGDLPGQTLMSVVVLRHWITQDWISQPSLLEQELSTCIEGGPIDIGTMICLLERRGEKVWIEQGQLFRNLLDIEKYSLVYDICTQMRSLGLELPMKLTAEIVEAVAKKNHILALDIFEQCISMRVCGDQLFAEYTPNFVLGMIDDPRVHPRRIWGILRIPIYGELSPRSRARMMGNNGRKLKPAMVSLITSMAVTFAHCKTRSPGVILRNVTQCLQHLRRYNASIDSRLSRAITHASINARIEFDKLIPEERAEWALRTIQRVEGPEVANTVAMIVDVWNEHKNRQLSR